MSLSGEPDTAELSSATTQRANDSGPTEVNMATVLQGLQTTLAQLAKNSELQTILAHNDRTNETFELRPIFSVYPEANPTNPSLANYPMKSRRTRQGLEAKTDNVVKRG